MKFIECKTFADVCAAMGRSEAEFQIVPSASAVFNESICRERLFLLSTCANGDRQVDLTDTTQEKWTPIHEIIKDDGALFGFRLTYHDYDYVISCSALGARPPFLDTGDARYAGVQFIDEFARWLYYLNKVYQEM